jgi:hypothetical protein
MFVVARRERPWSALAPRPWAALHVGCSAVMLLRVVLARFFGVMRRVEVMSVGDVGVVPRLVVIALLVVIRRVPMVFGRVLVMLSGLAMVLCSVMCHFASWRRAPFWV